MAIRAAITMRPDFCWEAICCKPPRLINCQDKGMAEGGRNKKKKKTHTNDLGNNSLPATV